MQNQNEIYEEVARSCSEYAPDGRDHSIKNVSDGSDIKESSCLNCAHFNASQHCDLDLYDKIVQNI